MEINELYRLFLEHPTVSTDSRTITPGCIYFSLKGEHFDGNAFALDSIQKGAAYAIVDDPSLPEHEKLIHVDNALFALQRLANYHRKQFDIPVVGITGSNGKTTTKELMYSVLSQKFTVLATQGNFNNHIGVPLTLLRLTAEHEIAIIEMGASQQGDIKELCDIADPNYALITNIGKAHLETMGGIEGVLKTKTELYDHIRMHGGKLLAHSCDQLLMKNVKEKDAFLYGTLPTDNVQGRASRDGNYVSVQWKRIDSEQPIDEAPIVKSRLTGMYNLSNIMAAVAIGVVFNLNDEEIANGISGYEPSNNRSEVKQKNGNTFILDAYNANPTSMDAAINNLMSTDAENYSVILGEMLEVGPTSATEHKAILDRLKTLNLTHICLVGKEFMQFKNEYGFEFFENVETLNEWLEDHPFENETVLIKGSRGNRLEKAAEKLLS